MAHVKVLGTRLLCTFRALAKFEERQYRGGKSQSIYLSLQYIWLTKVRYIINFEVFTCLAKEPDLS